MLSAKRVVSSAYLRLLIFLPEILIPACASSSPAFLMIYSASKLNKQGDTIQPWCAPFPIWNQSVVPCPVLTVASWPAYRLLKSQVRWSGIPISFRIFHSFYLLGGSNSQTQWNQIFLKYLKELQVNKWSWSWSFFPMLPVVTRTRKQIHKEREKKKKNKENFSQDSCKIIFWSLFWHDWFQTWVTFKIKFNGYGPALNDALYCIYSKSRMFEFQILNS